MQGSDGNFYGTTSESGAHNLGGTVFRITASGIEATLHSFGGSGDGVFAYAGLVQGNDGNFYGTTEYGGTPPYNVGSVFRISPSGTYTSLYSFGSQPNDGMILQAGLVQGCDGNFYGTTYNGGANSCNCGTTFRISPSGTCTSLYLFGSTPNDGYAPQAGLVQVSDGNLYGTTDRGGTKGAGTVFRITISGNYTNLYSFAGYPFDGAAPNAALIQGSDGNFYGTTSQGGTNNAGTIFKLTVPLSPSPWPINQITGVQPSGSDMAFSVVSMGNETYQLQFSSSMNPTNWVNVPGVLVSNSIGALLTLTNSGGAVGPQGFYRFAITP